MFNELTEVELFTSGSGKCYVADFLTELPVKTFKKIDGRIEMLRTYGVSQMTRAGFVKKLQWDIFEIPVYFNRVWYRILFIIRKGVCWLVSAFEKETNKTPQREIKTALTRSKALDLQLAAI